jgi:hypothetical protein
MTDVRIEIPLPMLTLMRLHAWVLRVVAAGGAAASVIVGDGAVPTPVRAGLISALMIAAAVSVSGGGDKKTFKALTGDRDPLNHSVSPRDRMAPGNDQGLGC